MMNLPADIHETILYTLETWHHAGAEQGRPSTIHKPTLTQDGNQWCALYGDNLACGVAGFGDSPAAAMTAFDLAWNEGNNE